jgi:hypothetical protein
MHVLKTVGLASIALAASSGIALAATAAAASGGGKPSVPGQTLPTVAASQAQVHAGPVLASHPTGPNSHANSHAVNHPGGKPTTLGARANADHPTGAPFSVPPVTGRPSSTPPVPAPPVPTPSHRNATSHPSGPPTPIPSHSHP